MGSFFNFLAVTYNWLFFFIAILFFFLRKKELHKVSYVEKTLMIGLFIASTFLFHDSLFYQGKYLDNNKESINIDLSKEGITLISSDGSSDKFSHFGRTKSNKKLLVNKSGSEIEILSKDRELGIVDSFRYKGAIYTLSGLESNSLAVLKSKYFPPIAGIIIILYGFLFLKALEGIGFIAKTSNSNLVNESKIQLA